MWVMFVAKRDQAFVVEPLRLVVGQVPGARCGRGGGSSLVVVSPLFQLLVLFLPSEFLCCPGAAMTTVVGTDGPLAQALATVGSWNVHAASVRIVDRCDCIICGETKWFVIST